jgi:methylmalonyl-CoA mutase cobalamin-binding subunit
MIVASKGDHDAALECFDEEIASASTHIYGREFAANARVATGFTTLARGDRETAALAFSQAQHHPKAIVGLYAISKDRAAADAAIAALTDSGRDAEAALVTAGSAIVRGEADRAVDALDRLLTSSPSGPAGWIIPIDPMLAAIREHAGKQALFAKLAARAA